MRSWRDDRGVATVYACLGIVLLLAVTALGLHLGAAVLARQHAETGADLAALAGAAKVLQGPEVVCAAALRVTVANGVDLQSCSVQGTDALVIVSARVGAGPFSGSAIGRARAGPVNASGQDSGRPASRSRPRQPGRAIGSRSSRQGCHPLDAAAFPLECAAPGRWFSLSSSLSRELTGYRRKTIT